MLDKQNMNSDKSKTLFTLDDPKRLKQDNNAYPYKLPNETLVNVASYLNNKELIPLSKSCCLFFRICESKIRQHALNQLLQAVIDDDNKKVKQILDSNPNLLLEKPEKLAIQSRLTWQTFYAEDALTMAVKRKQVAMIALLLPYFDQLDQTDTLMQMKADALKSWSYYENVNTKLRKEEINVPDEYAAFIKWLIEVFSAETFPYGTDIEAELSEDTEKALQLFRRITLPKTVIRLDDYLDPTLLFYAALKGYSHYFNQFQDWKQRDFFCVRVIGFIQSLQTREVAEVLCEGVVDVVNLGREISDQARSLKLLYGGESFYRDSFGSLSGLGGKFYLLWSGRGVTDARGCQYAAPPVAKFCQATQANFRTLQSAAQPTNQHSDYDQPPSCAIV